METASARSGEMSSVGPRTGRVVVGMDRRIAAAAPALCRSKTGLLAARWRRRSGRRRLSRRSSRRRRRRPRRRRPRRPRRRPRRRVYREVSRASTTEAPLAVRGSAVRPTIILIVLNGGSRAVRASRRCANSDSRHGHASSTVRPRITQQQQQQQVVARAAVLGTAQCAQVRASSDFQRSAECAGVRAVRIRPTASGRRARVAEALPSVVCPQCR
jgi:hypothetical protein